MEPLIGRSIFARQYESRAASEFMIDSKNFALQWTLTARTLSIVTDISDALQWAVEEGSMNESPAPDENLPPDGGGTPQGSDPAASDPDAGGDGSHRRAPETLFSIESVIARLGETLGMAPDIHLTQCIDVGLVEVIEPHR